LIVAHDHLGNGAHREHVLQLHADVDQVRPDGGERFSVVVGDAARSDEQSELVRDHRGLRAAGLDLGIDQRLQHVTLAVRRKLAGDGLLGRGLGHLEGA
jgi:hypothetical protein